MNIENTIKYFEEKTVYLLRFLYGWLTTEGEPLGYILGVCHITVCTSIIVMIIISHTFYPALWLQCLLFLVLLVIWLQHIFLNVCIIFISEYNLTKNEPPFYTLVHSLTKMNLQDWSIHFMVAETVAVGCFFLSLTSRFSLIIHEFYNIQL